MICDPSKGAPRTAAAWFNPNCFAMPGTGVSIVSNPYSIGERKPVYCGKCAGIS